MLRRPPIPGPRGTSRTGSRSWTGSPACRASPRRRRALAVATVVEPRGRARDRAGGVRPRPRRASCRTPRPSTPPTGCSETAGEARRLTTCCRSRQPRSTRRRVRLYAAGLEPVDAHGGTIVLDAALETLSRDQTVAIVDWAHGSLRRAARQGAHARSPGRSRPARRRAPRSSSSTSRIRSLTLVDAGAAHGLRRRPAGARAPLRVPRRGHGGDGRPAAALPRAAASPERVAVQTSVDGAPSLGGARLPATRRCRRPDGRTTRRPA